MRTTINISEEAVKEAKAIYKTDNMSKAIELALLDAVRMKKLEKLKSLKGKISFDEKTLKDFRLNERNHDNNE